MTLMRLVTDNNSNKPIILNSSTEFFHFRLQLTIPRNNCNDLLKFCQYTDYLGMANF